MSKADLFSDLCYPWLHSFHSRQQTDHKSLHRDQAEWRTLIHFQANFLRKCLYPFTIQLALHIYWITLNHFGLKADFKWSKHNIVSTSWRPWNKYAKPFIADFSNNLFLLTIQQLLVYGCRQGKKKKKEISLSIGHFCSTASICTFYSSRRYIFNFLITAANLSPVQNQNHETST